MFQFPGLYLLAEFPISNREGFPIRTSTDQSLCAAPRSFSQLTASFVCIESLGILHTPFFASISLWIIFKKNYLLIISSITLSSPLFQRSCLDQFPRKEMV
jgi:hypothetical protein